MHHAHPTSRRALILAALVALLAAFVLIPAPADAAPRLSAKKDKVVVSIGHVAKVSVLANDRHGKKPRIKIVRKPAGIGVKVLNGKRVKVTARAATKTGKYRIKYRLRDRTGRTDTANLVVRVKQPTVTERIRALRVAPERRAGYDRALFKHWNSGLDPSDGCDTRREVLLSEAVTAPAVGSGCSLTGGTWHSYYDGETITDSSKVDLDHVTPLAEAWDSGAYEWSAARREAYANDQGDPRSLVGVTASSNRSKGDRDPAEWMPPLTSKSVTCRYLADWVVVKTRWSLTVDTAERAALLRIAGGCGPKRTKVKVVH